MITVYKAVALSPTGQFVSAVVGANSKFCLSYALNQTTKPKIGKIFVFQNIDDAIHFANGVYADAVLECETTDLTFLPHGFVAPTNADCFMESYWRSDLSRKQILKKMGSFMNTIPPNKTLCCSQLTPLKIWKI